ncbi:hypothetical protein LINGRAPRIM_LOCUS70 [Linum grandiflorum]
MGPRCLLEELPGTTRRCLTSITCLIIRGVWTWIYVPGTTRRCLTSITCLIIRCTKGGIER